MNETAVIRLLATEIEKVGNQTTWADQKKIARSYVSLVLNGRVSPGWKILDALDVERVVTYRRKTT